MVEALMIWNEPNNKSHWDFEIDPHSSLPRIDRTLEDREMLDLRFVYLKEFSDLRFNL